MENIFLHLLKMSLTAGLLVVVVLLLRVVFCKAPRWIHCLLWALVAVRLLCPITLESSLSLMPDTNAAFSVITEQISTPQEEPDTPVVDNAVTDTPVVNTPVTNTPVVDTPVVDTPVVDTPVVTPNPNTPPSASVGTPTTNVAVSAPTPEASVDPWQVAVAVASYVWLAGVVLLAAYAVFTTLRLHRQVREAARLSGRVWCCDHIRSPFILGVFRPRIYLPSDLDGVARDSVIAHEQAHLHRRDHWWKPLGFLLLMVHWFNPLMWVAYILLCRDIEAACDERVVRDMTAPDRKTYSEVLLACSAPRRLVSACPLAFGETSVKSRVKSVLSYKKPTIWIIVAALLVSTVAGVCLLTDPKPEDGKPDTKITTTPEGEDSSKQPDDPDMPPSSTTTPNTEAENADYRWATYSHPVTVGDEGDVAVGYYSIFDYGRETLMPLVEGLEWYGADIMADTDFTYLGYFTIDGKKKYYVSPDKKQLYDGEQIADLTAEQSEQLDLYLRDGNPGEDAIAASVTGTVTEWSKEGGYIMLEVTEGDSKLGPRVMAYTTILMPGSAPAVGYPATIYYDGWFDGRGFGSAIYAIHREWQDADLLGGPDDDEPTDPGNPDDKWLNYTVIVRGEIGNPLSGVKINISSENVAETITTDSTGVAKVRLPEGIPTGTIEVPQGYVAASEKFTFAAGSTSLTIVLEKEQPVTPAAAAVIFNYTAENWLKDSQKEQIFGSSSVVQLASYDEMSSFLRTYSNGKIPFEYHEYDNAFFEKYSLLLTYHQTASGMSKPKVATHTYSADGTTLSVGVDEYWPSGLVTDDIGEWVMLSVIQKADLKGITNLTSQLRSKLPSNSISFLAHSTADPHSAVGEGTKALHSIESDVLNSYLISSMIDEEWGRWTPSSEVLFDVKLVINHNTYFYDIDSGRIVVTDGYMVHTMAYTMQFSFLPARTNMIDWILARYSDANDEVWIWEDFESRYYKNDAQPLNTSEMRAIALRTNWAENNSRNRTYDAQYTIGGALYLIDMEHEEVLTADEKQVSSLTKEEVAYLRSVLEAE